MKDKINIISKKKGKLPKAANGLTDIAVPEAGNTGNVLSSGLSGAATGASIAGPWGAVAGTALGVTEGLIQKDKQDALHMQALRINNDNRINRAYDGVETTANQKMQVFKKGSKRLKKSKLVEAEHNEHIFDKNLNHKGVVQGKTHKEGGEVIEVEEGDSIHPAKNKSKIDTALKKGDKKSIHRLKSKLPKDTGKKMADGTPWVNSDVIDQSVYAKRNKTIKPKLLDGQPLYADNKNRVGAYSTTGYNSAIAGLTDGSTTLLRRGEKGNPYPYTVIRNQGGTMWKHNDEIAPLSNAGMNNSSIPTTVKPLDIPFQSNTIGQVDSTTQSSDTELPQPNPAQNLGKYANVANNLIRGLQTPPTIEQSYLDPELLKYQDRSESLRRDSRGNMRLKAANARNLSSGMGANIRSNEAAASVENLENQDAINEREMTRADAVDNANVEIRNNAKQVNLARKDAYQDQLARQRAVQEQYINTATQEAAQLGEVNEERNYQIDKDNKTLNYLNQTTRYKVDNTGKIVFNPDSQTGGSSSYPAKTSTTKTIDAKGRESSKTTTSSSPDKSLSTSIFGSRRLKRKR